MIMQTSNVSRRIYDIWIIIDYIKLCTLVMTIYL